MRRRLPRLGVLGFALAALGACGGGHPAGRGADSQIVVLAASSLTEAFTDLADAFEEARPGTGVQLSFAASPALVAQIEEGAPADVFAAADEQSMETVVAAGDTAKPRVFARNRLRLAVARGNPKEIRTLADLAVPATVVVLCDAAVPCGRLADEVLDRARIAVTPASREPNVKATLARVETGEADAALVYATDVLASREVEGVSVPETRDAVTDYPIAVLTVSSKQSAARAFVDFVLSGAGQDVLRRHGFLAP